MNIKREPSVEQRAQAIGAIADIAHELLTYRGLDDAGHVSAEHMKFARMAVNAVAGNPIVASSSDSKYFGFKLPVYEQCNIGFPPHFGHNIEGIVRRIAYIPVRRELDVVWRQACLQVAPMVQGAPENWLEYYRQRGWEYRLNSPYGHKSKPGRSVWIPLGSLSEYFVQLPTDPEAAQYTLSPVPVGRRAKFS